MLVTLSAASRIKGSPSQPFLFDMSKRPNRASFFRETEKGMRVETDDSAWTEFINRPQNPANIKRSISQKANSKKSATGNQAVEESKDEERLREMDAVKKESGKIEILCADDFAVGDEKITTADKAINYKYIQDAKMSKLKVDREEIKLKRELAVFCDIETLNYYLSFIQRQVLDCYETFERNFKELKRILLEGDDHAALELMRGSLLVTFNDIKSQLEKEMKNA
jgi:hypothetical protein